MTGLNLYQRRAVAKKAVYEHEFQKIITAGLKYKYLPVEQIKPVVEKAWNDAGIVLDVGSVDFEDLREPWDVTSQYSGDLTRWYHIKGTLTIALVNIDNPSDRTEFRIVGEAKDNSDKVVNKIYTAAMKNFYKLEFNIAESPKDDTDATQDDESPKKIQQQDPFFGKKDTPKPVAKPVAPAAAPASTDAELCNIINVKGSLPKFMETVKAFKINHGAKTPYDLTHEERVELCNIITMMEETS